MTFSLELDLKRNKNAIFKYLRSANVDNYKDFICRSN